MKFGIFYEHQLPRPWTRDSEHKLFQNALDQVELADRVVVFTPRVSAVSRPSTSPTPRASLAAPPGSDSIDEVGVGVGVGSAALVLTVAAVIAVRRRSRRRRHRR